MPAAKQLARLKALCEADTREDPLRAPANAFKPVAKQFNRGDSMARNSWAKPLYSKKSVNRAARALIDPTVTEQEYLDSLQKINNWRASHSFPLNTFQTGLRKAARRIDPNCTVAQRIKRLPSILHKIDRFPTMTISQMQDIGGCRAILPDVPAVRHLVASYQKSNIKHKLHAYDDYITNPKPSGYRGVHLVYRYFSDRNDTYNTLLVEMQLRSQLQHAWATAVETVGTFVGQALKSSQGEEKWLRFFVLAGSAIALIEGERIAEDVSPSEENLHDELVYFIDELGVIERLRHYRAALHILGEEQGRKNHYFLVELNPSENNVRITGFTQQQSTLANDAYTETEQKKRANPSYDVVLVSVDSVEALKRAYPNYFADTGVFESLMGEIRHG